MSDLSLVRTLTSDQPQYGVAESIGDGLMSEFLYTNAPILPGTAVVRIDGAPITITADYSIDESLGLVTLTSSLSVGAVLTIAAKYTMLSDEQIADLLAQYSDSPDDAPKLAAADALDIIASSEALIQKKIKMLDLETDGSVIAKSLREHAKSLRDMVFNPKFEAPSFEIVEMCYNDPSRLELVIDDILRGS